MNILRVAVSLCFAVSCLAFSQTQLEMDNAECGTYQKTDRQLNQVYNRILREYRDDTLFIRKFVTAEKAWLVFRDAQLGAYYPDAAPGAYGSSNPMCRCIVLERLTLERIKELNEWLEGKEGDVCNGSIRQLK
jgi:uncharacterized protein YecT (DUF1311 family)